MKLIEVTILDAVFEAPTGSPDWFEKYETIVDKAQERVNKDNTLDMKYSERIRRQCNVVMDSIDELFGDGASRKVFGDEVDLFTALEAWKDFMTIDERCSKPAVEKMFAVFDGGVK